MKYPDSIKLATTSSDGYGDKAVTELAEIPAAFIKRAGYSHESNMDTETSDAAVYLLPSHSKVLEVKDDLEGMYVIVEPFGDNNWYRITDVNIAQRKLLNNAIDNVYCRLEKVAGMAYVYIS